MVNYKRQHCVSPNTGLHYRIKEKQQSCGQETGVFPDIRGYSRFVLMFIRSLSNFSDFMQATLTWGAHSKSKKKHSSLALQEKDKELWKKSQKLQLYMMYRDICIRGIAVTHLFWKLSVIVVFWSQNWKFSELLKVFIIIF